MGGYTSTLTVSSDGRTACRRLVHVDCEFGRCCHSRGFMSRRLLTTYPLPSKRHAVERLSGRGADEVGPSAASLIAPRPQFRSVSCRNSFRCSAHGCARLLGPAGQLAPAGKRRARRCHGQGSTEPKRLRSYRTGLCKRVWSYERTCMPAWQTQPTNSGHGLPAGQLI